MLRSFKYGLYGAVLAGLIAAPVVWNSVDKSVHLVVDGKATTVQTTAASVGQVVRAKGYRVSEHDLLAPSAGSSVHDDMRVVLRRGRLLHLNIDGVKTNVWTTAPTVSAALAQLGYTATDFVSVSRSRRLPLGPTDIAIRTPRLVTVVHDGEHQQAITTDATVGQLLADLGILIGPSDRLSAPQSALLTAGQTLVLQRVTKRDVVRTEPVKFPTSKTKDSTLAAGVTKIVTPGHAGTSAVTFAVVYVDGKLAGETRVSSVTLAKPTTQVVKIGTKPAKAKTSGAGDVPVAPIPSAGSAKAIAKALLAKRGWGSDQYDCLVQMWNRESGWRVNAANPSGAYGIPQALPGSKMSSAGPNWQTDATTQITWGIGYIKARYGTPCGAWSFWQAHNYY